MTMIPVAETGSTPADRDPIHLIHRFHELTSEAPLLMQFMEHCPLPCVLLTENRQAVAANTAFCRMAQMEPDAVLGMRPGEIMNCEYAAEGPGGCGTGEHCRYCGAIRTFRQSRQSGRPASSYCRLRLANGQALSLQVHASPANIGGHDFTVVFIDDVSHHIRKQCLERTFFHDVINTAGGIAGLSAILVSDIDSHTEHADEIRVIHSSAEHLLEEIECHRDLVQAESGDLKVRIEPVRIMEALRELGRLYQSHEVAAGRRIFFGEVCNDTIPTDRRLLLRILGNMIKNALEATALGGQVTVTCRDEGEHVVFAVHNDSVMPEEVRLQVFQQNFSTKGSGRGIGTHSIKLLGECYLHGRVSFTSEAPTGTTFELSLPKRFSGSND